MVTVSWDEDNGGLQDATWDEDDSDLSGFDPADTTSSTSSDDGETTLDTSTQTLGSTSLGAGGSGATDDEGDVSVAVEDSDNDPSSSSPAGGAGVQDAAERFAGLEDGALDGASEEEMIDVSQAASDEMLEGDDQNQPAAEESALSRKQIVLGLAAAGAVAVGVSYSG